MKKSIEQDKKEEFKMKAERKRKSIVDMELSTFEIPPSGDVLILGKRCPIGPEGAKRMLDSVAPDQFECVLLNEENVDAIFCKKHLFLRVEKERLIKAIKEEANAIMGPECMIRMRCDVTVTVKREL